jgi:uncharacterized membrane protein YfcA
VSVGIALLLVVCGVGVGFASALFGVGGGILMVPLIVLGFHQTQHVAEGTSLLVIVPTAVAGVLAQRRRGQAMALRYSALLAVGGVCGAYLGAALALRLPKHDLQAVFGVVLALTGVRVLRSGLVLRATRRQERKSLESPAAAVTTRPDPQAGLD